MNFFYRALKLFAIVCLSYFVANALGTAILRDKLVSTVGLFICIYYLVTLSVNQKFILLTITVFIPLIYGNMRGIELMGPIFCILLLGDSLICRKQFFSKKVSIYYIAIGVLLLWSLINYARNPVSAGFLGATQKEVGLRTYFLLIVGVMTFISSYLFIIYRESPKLLTILLYISLILGVLYLMHYFSGTRLYFLEHGVRSSKTEVYSRISGLSEMGSLGIISLLVLQHNKRWNLYKILLFITFCFLIIFSGGRAMFFATGLAVFLYVYLLRRKHLFFFTIIFILLSGTYVFVSENISLPNQIERVINVEGGLEGQDKYRWRAYQYYWEIFKENPVFGKGIGSMEVRSDVETDAFVNRQLMQGGHGGYISILSTYGIGGIFFLLTMLLGSMYHLYIIFKNKLDIDEEGKLALFGFLCLVVIGTNFYVAGTGFTDMRLWYLAGLAAGLKVKTEGGNN